MSLNNHSGSYSRKFLHTGDYLIELTVTKSQLGAVEISVMDKSILKTGLGVHIAMSLKWEDIFLIAEEFVQIGNIARNMENQKRKEKKP